MPAAKLQLGHPFPWAKTQLPSGPEASTQVGGIWGGTWLSPFLLGSGSSPAAFPSFLPSLIHSSDQYLLSCLPLWLLELQPAPDKQS